MLFMAIQTNNEMGGGVKTAARWQHGPTPGVKVLGSWVAAGSKPARTFIAFEAETIVQVGQYTTYLAPYCSQVEVIPVTDFLPTLKAMDAKNPELVPTYTALQKSLAQKYMTAKTVKEAVGIYQASL